MQSPSPRLHVGLQQGLARNNDDNDVRTSPRFNVFVSVKYASQAIEFPLIALAKVITVVAQMVFVSLLVCLLRGT